MTKSCQSLLSRGRGSPRYYYLASIILVIGCCFSFISNAKLNLLIQCTNLSSISSANTSSSSQPEINIPFKVYKNCNEVKSSAKYNTTITENAGRFHPSSPSEWKLTKSSNGVPTSSTTTPTLHFQILECPPQFMASTFHIQSSTNGSIFTGVVGKRYKVEEGCGYYKQAFQYFYPCCKLCHMQIHGRYHVVEEIQN